MFIEIHADNGKDRYLINPDYIREIEDGDDGVYIKMADHNIISVWESYDTIKNLLKVGMLYESGVKAIPCNKGESNQMKER